MPNAQKTKMIEYIRRTPDFIGEYLQKELTSEEMQLADWLSKEKIIVLTASGTSFHLAMHAARLLREILGIDAIALPSFDLDKYQAGGVNSRLLIALSHSGATKATLDAVQSARNAGCKKVATISFKKDSPLGNLADLSIECPAGYEEALPKTLTYSSVFVQLIKIITRAAELSGINYSNPFDGISNMGELLINALHDNQSIVDKAVKSWANFSKIFIIGGGVASLTALEIALKMRENNYTFTYGHEVEEIAHGTTVTMDKDTPVICLFADAASHARMQDILAFAHHVGAPTMAVVQSGQVVEPAADFTLTVPSHDNANTVALLMTLPLQYFSNQFSVASKKDPDSLRSENPTYDYGTKTWIFPPGTH